MIIVKTTFRFGYYSKIYSNFDSAAFPSFTINDSRVLQRDIFLIARGVNNQEMLLLFCTLHSIKLFMPMVFSKLA